MNYRITCFLLSCIAVFVFLLPKAEASDFYSKVTPKEEVALLFYKLLKTEPDFDTLAKESDWYKEAKKDDKPSILRKRSGQLQEKYYNDPLSGSIITLTGIVNVRSGKKYDQDGLFVDFLNNETPYFPFQFKEMSIALIPDGIENFMFIPMEKLDAKYVEHQTIDSHEAILFMEIRPWAANSDNIEMLDDHPFFLMLGSIARFVLYNKQREQIWYYKADWYTTSSENVLRRLYRKY